MSSTIPATLQEIFPHQDLNFLENGSVLLCKIHCFFSFFAKTYSKKLACAHSRSLNFFPLTLLHYASKAQHCARHHPHWVFGLGKDNPFEQDPRVSGAQEREGLPTRISSSHPNSSQSLSPRRNKKGLKFAVIENEFGAYLPAANGIPLFLMSIPP